MKLPLPAPLKWTFLLSGAVLVAGCRTEETFAAEQPAAPPPISAAAGAPPPAAPGAEDLALPTPPPGGVDTNAAALIAATPTLDTNAPAQMVIERPALSHWVQELVKLAESGVEDSVLLAFVQNTPAPFNLKAEEIVYLTDIGISDEVLTAMINHRGAGVPPATDSAPADLVSTQPSSPQPYQPAPVAEAAPEAAPAAVQEPQPQTQVVYVSQPANVTYFYSSLAPYGSWVDLPGYGYCWQPTVAVINRGWRPYSHRGRWIYSDCGWYWHSDYSWGWAPFHYGRWFYHGGRGWCWAPDRVWGPAWVSWRYSRDYCGWAPLPPGAHYRSGVGLTFHSRSVSVGFNFGLSSRDYTFVPSHRFYDRSPWRHAVSGHQNTVVYNNTTVINNYIRGNNNTIINEGIGRDRVAAMTRTEIRKAPIRDVQEAHGRSGTPIRSEKLVREGDHVAIYRPRPADVSGTPARSAQESRRSSAARSPGGSALVPSSPAQGGQSLPVVSGRAQLDRPSSLAGSGASRPFPSARTPEMQAHNNARTETGSGTPNFTTRPATSSNGRVIPSQPGRQESAAPVRTPVTGQTAARSVPPITSPLVNGQNAPAPSRATQSIRSAPAPSSNPRVPAQTRPAPATAIPQYNNNGGSRATAPAAPQRNFESRPAPASAPRTVTQPSIRQEAPRPSYQTRQAERPAYTPPAAAAPSYSPTRQQPARSAPTAPSYSPTRQAPASVQSAPAQYNRQPPSAPRSAPQSSGGGRSAQSRSER